MGSSASKTAVTPAEEISEKGFNNHKAIHEDTNIAAILRELNLESTNASSDGSLTQRSLSTWERKVANDPKLRLTRTILTHTDIQSALVSPAAKVSDPHVFNWSVGFQTDPITSQNSSGRCWLFATTNVLRYNVMKQLRLKEFQLSQSYLFFYDKLEKANYYLELSIQNAHLPLDDRLVNHIAKNPVNDGGQWDMAVNIMKNHGLVPRDVFPESFSSSSSKALNTLVTTKLREHALILRRLSASLRDSGRLSEETLLKALRNKKEQLMNEVYTMLSTTLGAPPQAGESFVWDYVDSSGIARSWSGTPVQFFEAFSDKRFKPLDSFSLIHDPRNDYGKLYTVEALGNIWGGRPVLYVNTEIDRLKSAVVRQIKAGHPVFFGCDVGKSSERTAGVMDANLYEYENAFNIKLGLTKAERLQTGESAMTHAMVISAVHLDAKTGKPVRYKVENSWGPDVGNKGYFVMTDKWFDEFVYQVVVPSGLAEKDHLDIFKSGEAVSLPPWDPMGALA